MAALAYVALAGAALNAASVKKKQKLREEKFLREQAGRTNAAMTAEMQELIDDKMRMESRALSVAATSGAGIDDPTVVNLIGDLNAEGEYRVMSRMWVGEVEAEGQRFAADEAYREGQDAENAGYVNAATSVLSAWGGFSSPAATTASALPSTIPKKTSTTRTPRVT